MGELPDEKARIHPYRNLITKAIGLESEIRPNYTVTSILDGDIFLLCSDGLWDMIPDNEIENFLSEGLEPKQLCKKLVNAANKAGGIDNITVVVLKFSMKNSN